ncbi:hypothetical protein Dred_2951 [Desulforamulus reducens MI-1]|uniref:Uncharacterized protein n=1 Tax=Desulforamulus reducens (strain ATCC BAA-1160 / DSM 100696 / MI-1) TaxID=349161 RepID=A4J8Q1_DESRM|nr:hypothetical protein [Desulforamulus reducens]ABO51454.1 hypothetical protein Dred_2951 [Desulforamulus reducens MI-1]
MSQIKKLKFTAEKFEDFSVPGDFDQLCNLCGSTGAEILPEVEFLNNKEVKSFCLSLFCSSKECRNLSYYYMELDAMCGTAEAEMFAPLPKGIKLSCNKCGSQNIKIDVKLEQSGFKYVYDLVDLTLSCSCGNCARHQFQGKYF